ETGISAEDSQKLSYEFLKEQFNALGIENIIELKMENIPYMQVSEQLDFIFDIATGRLVDGTYQKLEELGDSSKLKTVEFRLKE
ncbi:MAG: hypothetical protein AB8G22_20035, partial [Saprospiraceae bacterium]